MWEQLGTQVNEALMNVAAGLVALGAAYAMYFLKRAADKLKAETSHVQEQTKKQMIWHALDRLEETAEKVVLKTEQTVAGELRQALKDGKKADRAELLALGQRACREIMQILEPEVVGVLYANLGDLQAYVLSIVETQVKRLKDAEE